MRLTALALVLCVIPVATSGQAPPDGYACTETAFTALLSFTGTVRVEAGPDYGFRNAGFTWQVSDRGRGGRMTATWALAGRKFAGTPPYVFIPLRRDRAALPLTVTVTLDGQPVGVRRYERRGERVAVLDASGQQVADQQQVELRSNDGDRWIPELFGHSLLSWRATDATGAAAGGDDILLPRRDKVEDQIGPALGRAEKRRKRRDCDRYYILSGR